VLDRAHSLDDVPRLTLPDVSPRAYRRLTFIALVFLAAIIVTGALVRLTDSGLGCTDWPNCERGTLIRVSNGHQAVEQINRLFTGAMMIAVTVAVLASLRLVPRRRDLTWLSVSLVVGVLGQAVVGGVVVLTHLHPAAVVWHFLLSVVVLTAALVLHRRAGETGPYERTVTPSTLRLTRAVVAVTGLAIVAGTVVTGAGPHSGHAANDPTKVRRFGIAISSAARIHSGLVLCATAASFRQNRQEHLSFLGLSGLANLARLTPTPLRQWVADRYLARRADAIEAWALEEISRNDPAAVLEAGAAIGQFSSLDWISELDVPAAVLLTMTDNVIPLRRQLELHQAMPDAVAFRIDGRHDVVARQPDQFVSALVQACTVVAERGRRAAQPR